MATEHEIDRMVVRLVGNQDDYRKMLKDVERQTEESAKWAEERGNRISQAFNNAFRSAQGMMANIGSTTQKVGGASMAAGGAISAPLGKAAMDFSEYGKSIKDMVKETEKAAKEAEFMKKRLVENTEAYKELNKIIKLSVEQAQVFKLMSERTGISVSELTKTIKTNTDEYRRWRAEADKFGLVFDDEQIKNANELAESWQRVKNALSGFWKQIGSAVSKDLKEFNNLIIGAVTWAIKWVKENKELIATIGKVAFHLTVLGSTLTAIGTAITTLSTVLGPVVALVTAGAAAWLAWDTATGKALRGSATQVWEQYADQIKSVVNQVITYGKQIVDHVNRTMEGVYNAVKAGNLELAVQVLWSGVKIAWMQALNEIDKLTGEHFSAIFKNLAAGNWKDSVEALWLEIKVAWLEGVNFVTKNWGTLEEVFAKTVVELQKLWNVFMESFERGIRNLMMGLSNLLNWIAQNSGKIGAMVGIATLMKGKGAGEAALATAAGAAAANFIGSVGSVALNSMAIPEVRNAEKLNNELDNKLEGGKTARETQALEDEMMVLAEIADLNQQIADLAAKGQEEAAEKLRNEKAILEENLAQAEAERKATEAAAAKNAELEKEHERLRKIQEESLRIERDRQGIVEQYDPVTKYMRQLKELNALFKESERTTDVYKRALRDINEELVNNSWKVEVEFGLTGMDAVRRATREEQQLIENTLEMLGKKKAEEKALAEVRRREAGIESARAMAEAENPPMIDASGMIEVDSLGADIADVLRRREEILATDPFSQEFQEIEDELYELESRARTEYERAREAHVPDASGRLPAPGSELDRELDRTYRNLRTLVQRREAELINPEIPSPEEIEELNNDPTNPFGAAGMNAFRAEQERNRAEQLRVQEEVLGDPSNPFNMIGVNGRVAREPVETTSDSVTKVEDKESLDRLNRVAIAVEKMADRDVVQLYPLGGVVA